MLRYLFAVFVICLASNPSFAYKVKTFQPLQPAFQNAPITDGAYESYPKITQVENILFKRSYDRENIYTRLGRIESRMFRRQFSNLPLASRVDNILSNIDEGELYGITSRDLSKIETKIFGRPFAGEDTESRIIRLEKEMLGAMQNGNLKQRYLVVRNAAKHYNAFPQEYARNSAFTPNNYYNSSAPRPSILSRILDSLAGGVGLGTGSVGTMTGFTPPIYDPYSQYSQYPGAGANMQDYYMGNTGGYYRNRNLGSGAGVRILN